MRWSLQLLPYELWSNTTRGSKIFVTKAEYRVSAFRMRCKHAASLLIFTASSQCHGSSWCATMHPAAPSPGHGGRPAWRPRVARMVVELLAEVPIAATLRRIGPIPAHVDRPRRRHSIGGDDGAQCDTVKDGPVVGLLDPRPHRPHDRGGFHGHSASPAHRNMGPTGCDAPMSNCDMPGSDRDASMSGRDVTSSDDASMPKRDVTGHPDISTECGGFDSRYC
jgi:hypothetical protein